MDVDDRRVYADFYSYALALFNHRSDVSQGNRQSEMDSGFGRCPRNNGYCRMYAF